MTPDTPGNGDAAIPDADTSPEAGAETPSYVRPLSRGVTPSTNPLKLDEDAAREVAHRVKEIEDARATAAVAGRDYLIK